MGVPQRDRIGPYELLLLLARGGMAELYLGRLRGYAGFDRLIAVKLILPHLATDKTFVEMFINEGRIAARLSHPNICQVIELRKDGDDLSLAMEYLEGVGWDALVAVAPRDPRLVAGVLVQACEGLHHAHTHDIVHRDVSPQNLFVMTAGVCKVLDFGVSKIATDRNRTRTGVLKGKLPYMAPEQIEGTPVDGRADIWALGVILWEALAGRRLFDRESDFQIWKAITEEPVPPLGMPAIDRVIARALSRDRDARYATALELANDLDAAVGGAARHTEIADAVRTHCAGTLADLERKIEVAVGGPTEPAPEASLGDSREAAETVSMLMRKDSVMVARPRRRWWPIAVGASIAVAVAVAVIATRTTREPVAAAEPPRVASPTPGTPASATVVPIAEPRASTATHVTAVHEPAAHTPAAAATHPTAPRDTAARRDSATHATGTYAVDSTPYATIYVDGARIGDTPLDRVSLPVGRHVVKAVLADGRHQSFAIDIAADHKTSSGMLAW